MCRVSVLIPVYNAKEYLGQAIDSILNQTYQDFEIVLVDDCSTDGSLEVMKAYQDDRIQIYQNDKNSGIAFSRNKAIEMAKGEYLALLDNDDIALPYRLEHEVAFLDDNKDIDVVGGHLRRIDKDGRDMNQSWTVFLNPGYIKAYLMLGNTVANGTVMFRREFVRKHQIKFLDNMYGAEDYRFWVECSLHGSIANLDEVLLLWRVGHGNETQRVMDHNWLERKKVIDSIHMYALKQNGFLLDEEDFFILNKVFMEEGNVDHQEELDKLYSALHKIAGQAFDMKLSNAKEIVTMCRKRYGEKVGKAFFLWN